MHFTVREVQDTAGENYSVYRDQGDTLNSQKTTGTWVTYIPQSV